jgi:hypothetical protein
MFVELFFQFFDNLLAVLPLPFRFPGVVAEDVSASSLAITNNDFLGMQVHVVSTVEYGSGPPFFPCVDVYSRQSS